MGSAEDYPVVARVRDEYGNTGELTATIKTDILVLKDGDRYRIRVSSIYFKGFTDDFTDVSPEQAERNRETLALLAARLKLFPDYHIEIVGHAVMIYWWKPDLGKLEQEQILLPLSQTRAAAVKAALVTLGIEAGRIDTDGVGASDQVVPDNDLANRWQNRRVEFLLERK